MFPVMRRANKVGVLGLICAAVIALVAAASAGAATKPPTRAQIASALRTATRSKLLWATIDSCNVHGNRTVGIRGEMPALPFPAHLLMVVTVEEWSPTAHRYVDVRGRWKLGGDVFDGSSVVQNGLRLRWSGQVTLIAKIDFEWFRNGKLLGSTTRATSAGHAGADHSGYSVSTCSIH
jgi:hypothetical protein